MTVPDHNLPIGPGVAMVQPPTTLRSSIDRQVKLLVADLPEGQRGALVAVATTTGVNLAVVAKLEHGWAVQGFVGKRWSEPIEGGGSIIKSW